MSFTDLLNDELAAERTRRTAAIDHYFNQSPAPVDNEIERRFAANKQKWRSIDLVIGLVNVQQVFRLLAESLPQDLLLADGPLAENIGLLPANCAGGSSCVYLLTATSVDGTKLSKIGKTTDFVDRKKQYVNGWLQAKNKHAKFDDMRVLVDAAVVIPLWSQLKKKRPLRSRKRKPTRTCCSFVYRAQTTRFRSRFKRRRATASRVSFWGLASSTCARVSRRTASCRARSASWR